MSGPGYRYGERMTLPGRSRTIVVEPLRAPAKQPRERPAPGPPQPKPERTRAPAPRRPQPGPQPRPPPPRPPAPALVEPVVAFRAWRILDDQLLSPYIPCRWDGRVMHATCYPANRTLTFGRGWLEAPHVSPHPDCRCGIYAYHRPGTQQYFGEWEWA